MPTKSNEDNQPRYGSPEFYALLHEMGNTHHKKSHDYAKDGDPFANYKFAGMLSKIFNNPDDAGFIGRIGEKIYRIANIENNSKTPLNEGVEDTETDICVIVALWVAMRRERRKKNLGPEGSPMTSTEYRALKVTDSVQVNCDQS